MRKLMVAGLLLALTGFVSADEDPPKKVEPKTQAEKYAALQKEQQDAMKVFNEAYTKVKDAKERSKIVTELYPNPAKFADRYLEIAKEEPSSDVALQAIVQVINGSRAGKTVQKALELAAEHHLESDQIAGICQRIVYSMSPAVEPFLQKVMALDNRKSQAQACYALALFKKNLSNMATSLASNPEYVAQYKTAYGAELVDDIAQLDVDKIGKEVEKLFTQVAEEFGDVKSYRGTLGEAAARELFEIRNLSVGKVAPEIAGEDIDGEEFKLTDYRGKVVVLDFWGDW